MNKYIYRITGIILILIGIIAFIIKYFKGNEILIGDVKIFLGLFGIYSIIIGSISLIGGFILKK